MRKTDTEPERRREWKMNHNQKERNRGKEKDKWVKRERDSLSQISKNLSERDWEQKKKAGEKYKEGEILADLLFHGEGQKRHRKR